MCCEVVCGNNVVYKEYEAEVEVSKAGNQTKQCLHYLKETLI